MWKQKLVQMGGRLEKKDADAKGARINHVLAADAKALLRELGADWLHRFPGVMSSYSPRSPSTPYNPSLHSLHCANRTSALSSENACY